MYIKSLPAKFERDKSCPYVYDDLWLSNGYFAIKKMCVKNYERYCLSIDRAQVEVSRIIPSLRTPVVYKWTNQLMGDKRLGRKFISDCGKEVYLDNDYVNFFNLERVINNGIPDEPVLSEKIDFCLMPLNISLLENRAKEKK